MVVFLLSAVLTSCDVCDVYTHTQYVYTYIILYIPRKLLKECPLYQLSPPRRRRTQQTFTVHSITKNGFMFWSLNAQLKILNLGARSNQSSSTRRNEMAGAYPLVKLGLMALKVHSECLHSDLFL